MGGTGLEPVTPSLSIRWKALRAVSSIYRQFRERGLLSGIRARSTASSETRRTPFAASSGTGQALQNLGRSTRGTGACTRVVGVWQERSGATNTRAAVGAHARAHKWWLLARRCLGVAPRGHARPYPDGLNRSSTGILRTRYSPRQLHGVVSLQPGAA